MRIASWSIDDGVPKRLKSSSLDLERDLEDWIVEVPSLIDHELSILGRQINLEGGRLKPDLIAQNAAGALVVIEIKATNIYRKAVAQALDYAAVLRDMPTEELHDALAGSSAGLVPDTFDPGESPRDVEIVLVGVGEDPGASRIADYLRSFNIPVRSVSFEVLSLNGHQILLREEEEDSPVETSSSSGYKTVDEILSQISTSEDRRLAERVFEIARRFGLALQPYKRAVRIAPPQNRARFLMLVTVINGRPWFLTHADPFIEFFGFEEEPARELLDERFRNAGSGFGEIELTNEVVEQLDQALGTLFGLLEKGDNSDL